MVLAILKTRLISSRGELLDPDVDSVIDAIMKPVLDDHMKNDYRPFQKGSNQNYANIEVIPIVDETVVALWPVC